MVHPKNLRNLILVLLFAQQFNSIAQSDSLKNVSSFRMNINYLKKYTVENKYREVADSYPLPNTNGTFNGDSLARIRLDRGVRIGADFNLSLHNIKSLRKFSVTIGSWYQYTNNEIQYFATSKKNANGFQRKTALMNTNSLSSLFALNYLYRNCVRFSFGFNLNLLQKNESEITYKDGQVIKGSDFNHTSLSFWYSCIELPILFKDKLLLRAIASFGRYQTVYAGFGLAYRIKSFQPK